MLDMGAMLRFTILLDKLVCLGMFCYPAISDNFLGWEKKESLRLRLNLSCRPRVWERTLAKQKAWFSDFFDMATSSK